MKKTIKGYILGFLSAVVLVSGTTYAAHKVKIVFNGTELIPTDVNGKRVDPIIVDGTTYLPVRAIANALGLEVRWDETTQTVSLDAPDKPEEKTEEKKEGKPDIKEESTDKEEKTESAEKSNVVEGIGQIITSNIERETSKIKDEKSGKIYTVDGVWMVGDWGSYRIVDKKLESFEVIDHYGWGRGTVEKSRYTDRFGMNEFEIKLTDGTVLKCAPRVRVNEFSYKIEDCGENVLENIKQTIDGKEIWYKCFDDGKTVLKIETIN